MKEYFARLFSYDQYANNLMLSCIVENKLPEKPVKLMAHFLAAQQIWLNRCKGLPATGVVFWPDWKAAVFAHIITKNDQQWTEFLQQLKPDDFDNRINYQNSKGERFQNKLTDILAHVVNHGTHHRTQIGQHLKFSRAELPATDYIFYVRDFSL